MISNTLKHVTFIGALLLIVSLSACKKSTYHQLSDEEMTWLVYDNNEVLKFKNQNGDFLLYYITIRTKSYEKNGDVYSEFTTANFLQLNDTTALFEEDSKGKLYIYKGGEGFLVTFTWPHFALKEVPLTSLQPIMETIGGIIYSDVYVLDATGLTDLRNTNRVIWVSKSYGVLQIEDASGNVWVREL